MDRPQARAWFVDEPIAADDPLAHIKQRAAAIWAAGEVLEQAALTATVAARAEPIDAAAALFDSAFTTDEVKAMWRRSGLSDDDLDAAGNVALELWKIERKRRE